MDRSRSEKESFSYRQTLLILGIGIALASFVSSISSNLIAYWAWQYPRASVVETSKPQSQAVVVTTPSATPEPSPAVEPLPTPSPSSATVAKTPKSTRIVYETVQYEEEEGECCYAEDDTEETEEIEYECPDDGEEI